MINIGICDDEKLHRDIISNMCKEIFAQMNIPCEISCYGNGKNLLVTKKNFDIVFLDIDMPQMSGIELAENIFKCAPTTYIIFVTSHSEKMKDAFYVKAHRFVCKPIQSEEIYEALGSAVNEILSNEKILVDDDGAECYLKITDIVYIESLRVGVAIHTKDNYYISKQTLKHYLSVLQEGRFCRIHKSIIVSLEHIDKIVEKSVITDTGDALEISRRQKASLYDAFHKFVKSRVRWK